MKRFFIISWVVIVLSIVSVFNATGFAQSRGCTANPNKGPAVPVMSSCDVLNWNVPKDLCSQSTVAKISRAHRPAAEGPPCLVGFDNGEWTYDPWGAKAATRAARGYSRRNSATISPLMAAPRC